MENNVKKTETVSIVGFILSFIIPLVGLILSIIGVSKSKKNNSNAGLAIAGLIISIILLVIRIIIIMLAVIAFMAVKDYDGEDRSIFNLADRLCAKAETCVSNFGDFYNCEYHEGRTTFKITCRESQVPDGIIKHDYPSIDENKLEEIEDLVTRHYIKYYDGLYHHVKSKMTSGEMVEVILYESEDETEDGKVYTINRDTLIGKDFYDRYVDLNEFKDSDI